MYYVSYVEEYPIYEAAEGGYYYEGEEVQYCKACSTWKQAKRVYNDWRRWFEQEYGWDGKDVYKYDMGGCDKYGHGSKIRYNGRYIGEGCFVQITRYKPMNSGWHPYS